MWGGFDRKPEQWRFIFSAWVAMSYAFQGFGALWMVWGLGLTIWVFSNHDTSRMTPGAMVFLGLVLLVPSAIMFFGAWRFRRWIKGQLVSLHLT
jgi:hypothetical protein